MPDDLHTPLWRTRSGVVHHGHGGHGGHDDLSPRSNPPNVDRDQGGAS